MLNVSAIIGAPRGAFSGQLPISAAAHPSLCVLQSSARHRLHDGGWVWGHWRPPNAREGEAEGECRRAPRQRRKRRMAFVGASCRPIGKRRWWRWRWRRAYRHRGGSY